MVQHIHDTVDDTLKLYGHEDLIHHHDLHVVNERPLQVCHATSSSCVSCD